MRLNRINSLYGELTGEELYDKFLQISNLHELICFVHTVPLPQRIMLIDILSNHALKMRAKGALAGTVPRYHPLEDEIVRALAAGVDINEFMAERRCIDPDFNQKTIIRRWNKVVHLLQIYSTYANPILPLERLKDEVNATDSSNYGA